MVFSSTVFLLLFMPLCIAVYFLTPTRRAKNVVLLLFSLVFYAWGEPTYVVLMLVSIAINWTCGIVIGTAQTQGEKRICLAVDVVANLAILGFFKYESFLAQNINALLGTSIPDLELPLPIGISFYTLQALSYIIDVYRGDVPAQRNILHLGTYIAMFPQLVAGPIVRYSTIQEQILHRKESLSLFAEGLRLFVVGLAKKVLLANVVAILATKTLALAPEQIGAVGAWLGLMAFTFQIYFDFAGYSDMAIGLGKMFGFTYLRNFNYPYIARSATEFWRRWHISLSSFFRDYVYIPLGGNRVSTPRWILNILAVWTLTGLWHGAAWNFVLWGLFYGILLVCEKTFLLKLVQKLPSPLQHLYGIVCFMMGWLIFWIEDMGQMGHYFLAMFGAYGATGSSTLWELTSWQYLPVFALCALASTPIVPWVRHKVAARLEQRPARDFLQTDLPYYKHLSTEGLCRFEVALPENTPRRKHAAVAAIGIAVDATLLALLVLSTVSIVSGSFNPFIYFRF